VFELPGGSWGVEPQLFSQPSNTLKLCFLGGQLYTIYIGLRYNFRRAMTVEKFNPLANFSQFKHRNTGCGLCVVGDPAV